MIQCQFINYLIHTQDTSILLLNNINDEYFSDYKNEFDFIQEHLRKYGRIPDKETFMNKFPDFDIIAVNETPSYLIDELCKDRNARYLADNFTKVRTLLMENKIDEAMKVYSL